MCKNDGENCLKTGKIRVFCVIQVYMKQGGIACFGVKCSLKVTFSVRGMLVFAFSCRFTPCLGVG